MINLLGYVELRGKMYMLKCFIDTKDICKSKELYRNAAR